jgi:hypothetical protein
MSNPLVRELYDELGTLLEDGDDRFIEDGPDLLQAFMQKDGFFDGVDTIPAADGAYTRKRIIGGGQEDRQVIRFMEWPPDHHLPPHEHHGRPCFEVLVEGELAVTDMERDHVAGDRYRLTPIDQYTVTSGEAGIIDPRQTDIHEVRTTERSRSLHVYPVDKETCTIYTRLDEDELYHQEVVQLQDD